MLTTRSKYLIAAAQAVVSVGVLAWIASRLDLSESLASIASLPLAAVAIATLFMGAGFLISSLRWDAALHNFAIHVPAISLFRYYLMGLFFSMFLPTSVGGDAFRVYVVARSSAKTAAALFATVQERLIGLCGAVAVSLAVMPWAGAALPPEMRAMFLATQLSIVTGAAFVLYPPALFTVLDPVVRILKRLGGALPRFHSDSMAERIERILAGFGDLVRTRPRNVLVLLILALLPAIVISFSYREILAAMGVDAPVAFIILIIPLVWIVRLLPISLGGIGLGEGAFVVLAAYGGIDREKAFAAALAVLAIQIAWSLLGGLFLVRSGLKRAFALSRRG
jgi:uncharacterized protein (TIRG00374 family)